MKKWLLLITAIFILISGCLGSSVRPPSSNDISLEIQMENELFTLNSTSMRLSVKLINIAKEKISIYREYDLMMNIEITLPNNSTLTQIFIDDFDGDRIVLYPGDYKQFTTNLEGRQFNLNGSRYEWTMIGQYQIRCFYIDNEEYFYSDDVSFQIVEF